MKFQAKIKAGKYSKCLEMSHNGNQWYVYPLTLDEMKEVVRVLQEEIKKQEQITNKDNL